MSLKMEHQIDRLVRQPGAPAPWRFDDEVTAALSGRQ